MSTSLRTIVFGMAVSTMVAVGSVAPAMADTNGDEVDGVRATSVAADGQIAWQSDVHTDLDGVQTQTIKFKNGREAVLTVDEENDTVTVTTNDGSVLRAKASEIRQLAEYDGPVYLPRWGFNKCQAATGIAGIAHSTLWGTALGGPAGAAAGAAAGAFWMLLGGFC